MKKRKDGRYQKKVTLSDGRQKLVYGRTIAEVNQAADALRDQDRQGLVVGDTTTVDEWAKTWFATYKSGLRNNTQNVYRNAYNNHILPLLATLRLQDIRPVHVRQVMQSVADKSESLQGKVLVTMRQLFTTARQNGLMQGDPTEGIKITPHARPKKKEYLTLEEQDALIAALESADPRARCFVGLCLYCGLRREEALGLQWGDIQGDKLTVNRAVTFLNNQPDPIQELKSKSAHRTLPVPQRLLDLLAAVPRTSLYIITCADGEIMTRIGFRRMWDKVKRVSPCEVRPHQLRHSYCSNLYRAGIDLKTAQYLMGHATIQMTANIYTHMEKEDASASLFQLERYLSGGSQTGGDFSKSSQKVVNP
ncbi:tyrosine-type recombinase/integrase [Acutalibacter sp. 1XD8-33]|uniref:tyrosine-type recombinase/integrase n=1 Tax=Acutalibacter sp. 1XD8-33 TaxID=2320081 RepID=UPI0013140CD2|nr:site-specific integrase [Acutalibacter sp. 1XD8-33]